ncbi:glyoxal oxidase [Paracoccidioides lutzii Pb01]|uniref:Glyoxal oxidase n=1 Tax=Paracoccidioides lutzii (strain ATCC MYA-826 / Pb01) TaxID=502779 RepID=C1GZA9_PARBA|nr:glyoxal oxidase [Paracoccidioides lutzii Pb01]EEH41932.2 glyoxal oxidase [Paracoccidioides lutzii Pb01]
MLSWTVLLAARNVSIPFWILGFIATSVVAYYCSPRCEVDHRHTTNGPDGPPVSTISTVQKSPSPTQETVTATPPLTTDPVGPMRREVEDDVCYSKGGPADATGNRLTRHVNVLKQSRSSKMEAMHKRAISGANTHALIESLKGVNPHPKLQNSLARENKPRQQEIGAKPMELKQTADGLCGPKNGNTICGAWPGGSCCSPYGFCGSSSSHCGPGCQSGDCEQQNLFETLSPITYQPGTVRGNFRLVGQSGVPAMSAALMSNGRVVFVDKVENYTQLVLPNGQYAYSSEYDPETNEVVPLSYKTNAFCSGGAFLMDGRLVNIGGNSPLAMDLTVGDGFRAIRYLTRPLDSNTMDGASWEEPGNQLSTNRWYASAQILRDGSLFVASGSLNGLNPSVIANNNPTYESLDKNGVSDGKSVIFPILERNQPYFMYPFLHLLKDGTVFVFVSRSAEIFDAFARKTVKTLPDLPGDYRTYPNTGGSVLLPLSAKKGWEPEVVICGGGAFVEIDSPTDPSCGRIKPLSPDPEWEMELMPAGRVMVEGMMLPDGMILWVNGCNRGSQGFGIAKDPTFDAWVYDPEAPSGHRWGIGGKSEIPRMYHSVALLLLDGSVMIAGSNPVEQPILVANPDIEEQAYVTEFRVEIYTPHYLLEENGKNRPSGVVLSNKRLPANGKQFTVEFRAHGEAQDVRVVLYHGGFVTHSLHMGHRMLYLEHEGFRPGRKKQRIQAKMPPDSNIAPPGPYVVYIVVDGIPSVGQFLMVEVD